MSNNRHHHKTTNAIKQALTESYRSGDIHYCVCQSSHKTRLQSVVLLTTSNKATLSAQALPPQNCPTSSSNAWQTESFGTVVATFIMLAFESTLPSVRPVNAARPCPAVLLATGRRGRLTVPMASTSTPDVQSAAAVAPLPDAVRREMETEARYNTSHKS